MKISLKEKMIEIIKKDTVLVIAAILAVISMFFNPPSKEYIEFIDFRVLGILLSLMIVMAGLSINGIFEKLGKSLISKCSSTRALAFVLIFLCFFSILFYPFYVCEFIANSYKRLFFLQPKLYDF